MMCKGRERASQARPRLPASCLVHNSLERRHPQPTDGRKPKKKLPSCENTIHHSSRLGLDSAARQDIPADAAVVALERLGRLAGTKHGNGRILGRGRKRAWAAEKQP